MRSSLVCGVPTEPPNRNFNPNPNVTLSQPKSHILSSGVDTDMRVNQRKKEVQHASRMPLHWLRRWNNHASLLCATTAAGPASPNSIYGKRHREWTPN